MGITFSAPSMMEYASHVDSHKGKQGQKASLVLQGNSSKGVKTQMETQMMSQIKSLMETQVKSNQLVQQQLMQQALKQQAILQQQLLMKKQQNLQQKCPETNCAYKGAIKQDLKV